MASTTLYMTLASTAVIAWDRFAHETKHRVLFPCKLAGSQQERTVKPIIRWQLSMGERHG